MARDTPIPLPRRRTRRERTHAAAPVSGVVGVEVGAEVLPAEPVTDEARTVFGWLSRLTTDPAVAERLLVEILRRAGTGAPAFLRTAPLSTRLQYLTVESVLRLRGVL
jgi:hypothetical protein